MTVTETTDFHVKQFDGDGGYCDSKNCAAATGAMDLHAATGERMTSDDFRAASGVSCVPRQDTASGGLTTSAVERVIVAHGGNIDWGWVDGKGYTRWAPATLALRLEENWGAHLLIDYGYLRSPWRAPGSSFTGDHSGRAHDYRRAADTYCWHDPLRPHGIRIPSEELYRAWWPPSGALAGIAGFVRQRVVVQPPDTSTAGATDVAIRYSPTIDSPNSRMRLAAGQRLYDAPGGNAVTKMATAGSPAHLGLATAPNGKLWRAVQVGTGWSYDKGIHKTVLYVPASAGKVTNG